MLLTIKNVLQVLMKHLEESHKHLEDEQDMDNQLEREFQEKQDLEERKDLYSDLQKKDSEYMHHKPLAKVCTNPYFTPYFTVGTYVLL